jgi:integrase
LYLGKRSDSWAEEFRWNLEQLLESGQNPDPRVTRWLASMNDRLHTKLVEFGIAQPRIRSTPMLGVHVATWLAAQCVKPNTRRNYEQASSYLLRFFGAQKDLRIIAENDGEQFRTWLCGHPCLSRKSKDGTRIPTDRKLARPTVSKFVKVARQTFKAAVKGKVIGHNPFDGVKAGGQSNRKRQHFVTLADIQKVIDASPDAQWRLLLALSRYGGMRCPSEHLALRWQDVDFVRGQITVWSSKTEHNEGGECRMLPMFPELRPYLEDALELAEKPAPTDFVITRYRDTRQNLRTQLCRIIREAGVKIWPRPWHNLRASRQTELVERHPAHVVCSWLGNSIEIARDHYLQITDAQFERAVNVPTARQTAQQVFADARSTSQASHENADLQCATAGCDSSGNEKRSPEGSNL